MTRPETTLPAPVPPSAMADAPRARLTLMIASLGFFLITLDILIVNVALTSIGKELGGGTSGLQWVIDGYTLMFAALLLFAGNLSDRIGAKRALGWGSALFLVASVACALAPTSAVLIAARFLQGGAASIMLPASMALIRQAFPDPRRRAHALGIWAVGGAVAGAVGPLVGGLLTTLDWRLVFGINLPVCIAMLVLLASVATSPRRPTPFDWAGQAAAIVALTALMYGLITGGTEGFGTVPVIASLALAAISLAAFLLIQARGRHPMMPLELFRSTGMRISLSVGFAFMVGHFGTVFVVSLFLQQHLGLTPLQAGFTFLPSAAFSIVGNIVSGTLSNRFGTRVPVVVGLTSMVVGLTAMLLTAPLGSPLLVGTFLIFTGSGGSIAMPQVTAVVLASVPSEKAGTASAVFNTFRQVGGAVAIAVFGALIADRSNFVHGMQTSFIIAASLLLLTALASLFIHSPGAAKS
ncbi:DHA2 family methylenomycin A resistance protein-like MFS transporter [Arthrobacter sp. GAS37]|uniref:MFS transporter n=1 Tax=Arthrobacter sp. GAS37 TaxID=3156261 RepID=UPI003836796F